MFENVALEFRLAGLAEVIDPEGLGIDSGLEDTALDHPVQKLFKAAEYGVSTKIGDWDEQISKPLEKKSGAAVGEPEQHQDGTFVERCGDQTWTYIYRDGKLVSMSVEDPTLPDGKMWFNADGDEVPQFA